MRDRESEREELVIEIVDGGMESITAPESSAHRPHVIAITSQVTLHFSPSFHKRWWDIAEWKETTPTVFLSRVLQAGVIEAEKERREEEERERKA